MTPRRVHYAGVCGTGMSALAQFDALQGLSVSGSDRAADRGEAKNLVARLEKVGVRVLPQDGSGVSKDATLVVSTAIEADNKDVTRAKLLGARIVHRADYLAALADARRTAAVAGTSGKSTTTAMLFEILRAAGLGPSLISGANLPSLRAAGLVGNAWLGTAGPLVIEADESDGTLTRYRPELGLLLNVSKDHKEMSELLALFREFRRRSKSFVVGADARGLEEFRAGARTYGFGAGDLRGTDLAVGPRGSRFRAGGVLFELKVPGAYNAENALAAIAAARELGAPLDAAAAALRDFGGVGRRFEVVGEARGVEVVDDFAHNPEKVRAVLGAARLRAKRVLAVFQLHGFAPARFMKAEFLDAFAESLGPADVLWLPDIYYVGGTAAKDVSAAEYADALAARGAAARYRPDRA
ncbi:MAG: UDP-N-acetylmuramate--alanine ligase, partial [Elusimicrobia bacterium]|nr:UDP-N-acetylmuramate--alanine ligase [Elusimicrobiota bacterium]